MEKMTIRIILKSGAEFAVKCDKFGVTRDALGNVTDYKINGITENKPVYLDFEQVAAIVRVYSDERTKSEEIDLEAVLIKEPGK